jgi:hypothetical protein
MLVLLMSLSISRVPFPPLSHFFYIFLLSTRILVFSRISIFPFCSISQQAENVQRTVALDPLPKRNKNMSTQKHKWLLVAKGGNTPCVHQRTHTQHVDWPRRELHSAWDGALYILLTWKPLQIILLSENNQKHKVTDYIVPFLWPIQSRQIHRSRKQLSRYWGMGLRKNEK